MLSDKNKKILKVVLVVLMVITVAIATELFVEIFAFKMRDPGYELSFWASHFAIGVAVILIGGIALIMPLLAKTRYSDDSKDGIMIVVAALLFIAGLIAIIYSFIVGGMNF